MKIAFINGSPKVKDSNSGCVLNDLKALLPNNEILDYKFCKHTIDNNTLEELSKAEVFILAFPLYVDSLPAHLISCLYDMENYFKGKNNNIKVYALVNSGFYDAIQNKHALEIIKNWCTHCNFTFGQGVGIGAGGMLSSIKNIPSGKGVKRNISKAYEMVANNILLGNTDENIFVSPNFPRVLYKLFAEISWRKQIKANGLNVKDLFTKK